MTAAVEETGLGQAAGKAATLVRDSVKTVIAASMVGTAIEFYDFYAYGTAAANYFPHIFFSAKDNPTVALLMSLLTFAVAFIARPLGSLIFGHFGDRMGRKTTLVSGQEDGGEAGTDEEAVYTGGDYFASARLTRQQARDNAISLLQEAADQSGADAAVANEASEGIQVLAGYTMKEAQIENLVTAKGYTDCVAFMGEDSISVVVDTGTGELTAEDVAKITDIAMTETGYPASGIKIMASN